MGKLSSVAAGMTLVAAFVLAGGAADARNAATSRACSGGHLSGAYAASVRHVLRAGRDLWGERLLRSRSGPTYEGVAARLKPLLFAAGPRRRYVTDSRIYYLPFGRPSRFGAKNVALHLADGSGVIAKRTKFGPKLTIAVADAHERYGSCLARLATPQLLDGYLPVLQTEYVDRRGVRYRQESFAVLLPETQSLVSFVRIAVDASATDRVTSVRFTPSRARGASLTETGALMRDGKVVLFTGEGARFNGKDVVYDVEPGTTAVVYAAWPLRPVRTKPFVLDEASYLRARDSVATFWTSRLGKGATFEVPEQRVQDAAQSLLIQNLTLGWRYSVGNRYSRLSTPEAIDAASVLGEYGFADANAAILEASFFRSLILTTNWKIGEQLLGSARYYDLVRDRKYIAAKTPKLARYVAHVRRQLVIPKSGLLRRERFSADVAATVYGLHTQAVVWQGLRAMSSVWARTGSPALAARANAVARRLGSGLRRAIHRSERRLRDGSLFIPIRLLDGERPYKRLTASWAGSYWNLVMPYALASGIVPPRSVQATGVLRYMLKHGSRIVGLVRAGAFTLYGRPRVPKSGTDQVYGLNVARFLADNDKPGQLVLSLYGQLAAGMTPGTHVSGEAATIAPVRGEYYRRMYLPPNSGSNAAFLETLRLMLVHERRNGSGNPIGLELAFATPRAWLLPGRRIQVAEMPTSFGPVSYSLAASAGFVDAQLTVPRARRLKLRLRLPAGRHLRSVLVNGQRYRSFDPATGTIDLSGHSGTFEVEGRY
jgi:hypothetical protein